MLSYSRPHSPCVSGGGEVGARTTLAGAVELGLALGCSRCVISWEFLLFVHFEIVEGLHSGLTVSCSA